MKARVQPNHSRASLARRHLDDLRLDCTRPGRGGRRSSSRRRPIVPARCSARAPRRSRRRRSPARHWQNPVNSHPIAPPGSGGQWEVSNGTPNFGPCTPGCLEILDITNITVKERDDGIAQWGVTLTRPSPGQLAGRKRACRLASAPLRPAGESSAGHSATGAFGQAAKIRSRGCRPNSAKPSGPGNPVDLSCRQPILPAGRSDAIGDIECPRPARV